MSEWVNQKVWVLVESVSVTERVSENEVGQSCCVS